MPSHSTFDLVTFREVVERLVATDLEFELGGAVITGPLDVTVVEICRDKYKLRSTPAVPTDVFVFNEGEPSDLSVTKIGGVPYWPKDVPWPVSDDGTPQLFLAQFNFTDSRDIIGTIPGDLLIITATSHEFLRDSSCLKFHWMSVDGPIDPAQQIISVAMDRGPYFGSIHRTFDYPSSFTKACGLADVPESFLLPLVQATKIGGVPPCAPTSFPREGRFLCQLSSIWFHSDRPWPLVNREAPVGKRDRDMEFLFGDVGYLMFYLMEDQTIDWEWRCY